VVNKKAFRKKTEGFSYTSVRFITLIISGDDFNHRI